MSWNRPEGADGARALPSESLLTPPDMSAAGGGVASGRRGRAGVGGFDVGLWAGSDGDALVGEVEGSDEWKELMRESRCEVGHGKRSGVLRTVQSLGVASYR